MSRHKRRILRIKNVITIAMIFIVPLLILGVWMLLGWIMGSNMK